MHDFEAKANMILCVDIKYYVLLFLFKRDEIDFGVKA